ncbi:isochorismatase family cysteine hydrolase [Clostridium sp. YIM B02551]|uniref:isochorismatase family cysteine hydrolase n=1 Tax=Clostridium sp. YIM B02551 TaxID=2910679 RepID=UPI001EEA563A|nr:isochorismatase family cysteine hydrolase [Clostridium sp. YIM B02551]
MNNENNKRALLVIDIQEDATGTKSKNPYKDAKKLIDNANLIINESNKKGITIIYIKHYFKNNIFYRLITKNRFIKGTPGSEIDSRINIIGNNIFTKEKGDAFTNPYLNGFINEKGIKELFIIGLDAADCVYKTSKGAKSRGYKVFVIVDAIVTSNMGNMPKILEKFKQGGIGLISFEEFKKLTERSSYLINV